MKQVKLGNIGLNEYTTTEGFVVTNMPGLEASAVVTTVVPKSGKDGVLVPTAYSRERRITIEGTMVAKTKEKAVEMRRKLSSLVSPVRNNYNVVIAKELFLEDFDGAQYKLDVVVNGLNAPRSSGMLVSDWQFDLIAKDWRIFSMAEKSVIFTQIQGGYFSIPFSIPFSFEGGTGEPTAIMNDGDTVTPFRWVVNGPATNPTLVNTTTGQFIQVNTVIGVGDKLIVDTAKQTVTINGANGMQFVSGNSNFFELDPGETVLTITTAVPSEEPVSQLFWRDAFGGL